MALAIIIHEHIAELNSFFEFSWVLSISLGTLVQDLLVKP